MTDIAGPGELDVSTLIDEGKSNAFQIVALAAVALAFALEGLAAQAFGLALPALSRAWRAPHAAFASVTAFGLVGFAIGAAVAGICGDRFGRRTALIASVGLFGAATLATAFAHDLGSLGWVRFATGLGLGGSIPVAAALISELAPARWRSQAIALGFMFLPIGGFVSGLLASRLLPTAGWPSLFIDCGSLALVCDLVLLAVLPESPRFLALKPARRPELLKLLARLGLELPAGAVLANREPARASWTELFSPEARRDTLGLQGASFFLLLGMYLVFSWGPSVLASQGFTLAQASEGLSAFALGGVFAGPVSGWIIQRLRPRASILVLAFGAAVAAAYLAWTMTAPAPGFMAVAAGFFLLGHLVSGVQTALYALAADVYPTAIRSSGVGAAVAAGRIGAVFSSYLGVLAIGLGGAPAFFGFVAAALALALLASSSARARTA